jgi:hypothetical protein
MPVYQGPRVIPTYLFSMDAVANVALANNYVSLFNPVGSGRILSVPAIFISSTLFTSSSISASLRGYRITTATGGTLQADSAIAKLQNTYADPVAEVRTLNPSCTLGPALFNSPSPIQDKAAPVHDVDLPPQAPPLTLVPGEGAVIRSSAGIGASAFWNITMAWTET